MRGHSSVHQKNPTHGHSNPTHGHSNPTHGRSNGLCSKRAHGHSNPISICQKNPTHGHSNPISTLQKNPTHGHSNGLCSKRAHGHARPHMDLDMTCDRGVQLTPSQASMHLHGPPPSSHVMVRLKSSSGGSAFFKRIPPTDTQIPSAFFKRIPPTDTQIPPTATQMDCVVRGRTAMHGHTWIWT